MFQHQIYMPQHAYAIGWYGLEYYFLFLTVLVQTIIGFLTTSQANHKIFLVALPPLFTIYLLYNMPQEQ